MKVIFRRALAACLVTLSASLANAEVKLPQIFSDDMVLQQKTQAPVWGWAEPGEKVTVTLGDAKAEATTNEQGKWMTKIQTPAAGGPMTLVIKGKNEIVLKNVLMGEVWVCSGQSNMQWSVAASTNAKEEIENAKYPKIRLFTVPSAKEMPQPEPQADLGLDLQWTECTPQSVPGFSAVAYFFGRKLQQELDVPIGLINTSWGGTICEAWTSKPAARERSRLVWPDLGTRQDVSSRQPQSACRVIQWHDQSAGAVRHKRGDLVPRGIESWSRRAIRQALSRHDYGLAQSLGPRRFSVPVRAARPIATLATKPATRPKIASNSASCGKPQLKTLKLPNTGMAVTTDITELFDIHPKNKQDVGQRLALWALANSYEKSDVVYSGPLYDSMAVEDNKIRLKFKHVGGGLEAKDGQPLNFFTIAGEDQAFVDAKAEIDGDTIVVTSDKIEKPVAVRFGWSDFATPNLFNKAGLPASPFRTDAFPMVTAGRK